VESRWLEWPSVFFMGEFCKHYPTISYFLILQQFIMRGEISNCFFASFFVGKKLNITDITNFFWKINVSVRGPPFFSETEKTIRIRKEDKDERT